MAYGGPEEKHSGGKVQFQYERFRRLVIGMQGNVSQHIALVYYANADSAYRVKDENRLFLTAFADLLEVTKGHIFLDDQRKYVQFVREQYPDDSAREASATALFRVFFREKNAEAVVLDIEEISIIFTKAFCSYLDSMAPYVQVVSNKGGEVMEMSSAVKRVSQDVEVGENLRRVLRGALSDVDMSGSLISEVWPGVLERRARGLAGVRLPPLMNDGVVGSPAPISVSSVGLEGDEASYQSPARYSLAWWCCCLGQCCPSASRSRAPSSASVTPTC